MIDLRRISSRNIQSPHPTKSGLTSRRWAKSKGKSKKAKAATSSGANYEESQAGSSKPDFANKILISLRVMSETNYWLRLCEFSFRNGKIDRNLLKDLLSESGELKKILASILNKCQKPLLVLIS